MKRILFAATISAGFLAMLATVPTHALGLKIAPLEYRTELKKDEDQKGFIDVSNPSGQTVVVEVSVQAFKQINDDGGLQFYDDERVEAGIVPELDQFKLGPREAIRVYFTIDSAKLPEGDVYAAVFFSTEPAKPRSGVGQQVRVGTLLSIVNRTPGDRKAVISKLNLSFLQLDERIKGSYTVKNTGSAESGFYPKVTILAWPSGRTVERTSLLVFGGRMRENPLSFDGGVGLHRLTIKYGDSSRSQWVLVLPVWIMLTTAAVLLAIATELLLWHRRKKKPVRSATS